MPMPVGTLSPKPEPTTAPVSKSPVTSPPVDIIITISPLETVSTDAPATPAPLETVVTDAPATPAPIDLVVTSDPVTAAPVMSPIETAMTEPPITLAPAESSTPVTLVPVQLPTSPPMASLPTESPVSERDLMIAEKCGITPLERSESLLSIATTLFSSEDLSNPLSPSTASLDWVDNEDPAILCPDGNRVSQRLVVSNMYFSMDGAAWINCGVESDECVNTDERITREPRRWLTSSHECLWYGLFCEGVSGEETPSVDEILHLTVVDLPDNNMGGTVPLSLFHLGKLQILTMDGNGRIAGSIPSDIAKLTSLTVIDIDENMLTGTLPIELFSLTNLEAIDLNNNKLTGSLPLNIGNLKNLGVLQLENNRMAGPIPEAGLFMLERMGRFSSLGFENAVAVCFSNIVPLLQSCSHLKTTHSLDLSSNFVQ